MSGARPGARAVDIATVAAWAAATVLFAYVTVTTVGWRPLLAGMIVTASGWVTISWTIELRRRGHR